MNQGPATLLGLFFGVTIDIKKGVIYYLPMVTKKPLHSDTPAPQRGRLTIRFYDASPVPGFIAVDQMLEDLVDAKHAGKTANKVIHTAIKLLHRESFTELYESPSDAVADRLAQRERDRQAILGGHDIATRAAATEAARQGLYELGGKGQGTLADMLVAAGWKKGAAGEWVEPKKTSDKKGRKS